MYRKSAIPTQESKSKYFDFIVWYSTSCIFMSYETLKNIKNLNVDKKILNDTFVCR